MFEMFKSRFNLMIAASGYILAVSPHGKFYVSALAADPSVLGVFDCRSHEHITLLQGHTDRLSACQIFTDTFLQKQCVVTASWDGTLRVWDLAQSQNSVLLKGHTGRVTCCAIYRHPVTQALEVISGSDDGELRKWNLEESLPSSQLLAKCKSVTDCVVFTGRASKEALLVCTNRLVNDDGDAVDELFLWDLTQHASLPQALVGHSGLVNCFAVCADSVTQQPWLISGGVGKNGFGELLLWNLQALQEHPIKLKLRVPMEEVTSCEVYINSFTQTPFLVSGHNDGMLYVWNLAQVDQAPYQLNEHTSGISCSKVYADPSEKMLKLISISHDNTLKIWNLSCLQHMQQTAVLSRSYPRGTIRAAYADVSSENFYLVFGEVNAHTLQFFKLNRTQQSMTLLQGHTGEITHCAMYMNPNNRALGLVSGCNHKTLLLWDLDHPEQKPIFLNSHHNTTYKSTFHHELKTNKLYMASPTGKRELYVWDILQLQNPPLQLLREPRDSILCCAFYVDSKTQAIYLVAGGEQTLTVWNLSQPQLPCFVLQTGSRVAHCAVYVHPLTQIPHFICAGYTKVLQIWSPAELHKPTLLEGHTDGLLCFETYVDPRSQTPCLVSGDRAGNVIFWDLLNLKKIAEYRLPSRAMSFLLRPCGEHRVYMLVSMENGYFYSFPLKKCPPTPEKVALKYAIATDLVEEVDVHGEPLSNLYTDRQFCRLIAYYVPTNSGVNLSILQTADMDFIKYLGEIIRLFMDANQDSLIVINVEHRWVLLYLQHGAENKVDISYIDPYRQELPDTWKNLLMEHHPDIALTELPDIVVESDIISPWLIEAVRALTEHRELPLGSLNTQALDVSIAEHRRILQPAETSSRASVDRVFKRKVDTYQRLKAQAPERAAYLAHRLFGLEKDYVTKQGDTIFCTVCGSLVFACVCESKASQEVLESHSEEMDVTKNLISQKQIHDGNKQVICSEIKEYYNLGLVDSVKFKQEKDDEEALHFSQHQGDEFIGHAARSEASRHYHMGLLYSEGLEVEKDKEKAVHFYRLAAEQGNAQAQFNLSLMYLWGTGVEKNESEFFYWCKLAAEQGEESAQYNLGLSYLQGRGVEKDREAALYWLELAAKQNSNNTDTLRVLGRVYLEGDGEQQKKGAHLYRMAAELGDARAQYRLGACYAYNRGVMKDEAQAVYWYSKAAEQKLKDAQYALGLAYAEGYGVNKDEEKAITFYRNAAEQGLSAAEYALGLAYTRGRGVDKDEKEAISWYLKAAKRGYVDAQYVLGVAYQKGIGVQKDANEAVSWYCKAAKQGQPKAQYMFALAYDEGTGVEVDHQKANRWYHLAAEQGHKDAQFNLAFNYKNAVGVEKNLREALRWYQAAAEQGDKEAAEEIAELKKKLNESTYIFSSSSQARP